MPRPLVDANIFLELQLEQSRSRECKEFLSRIARGAMKAVTTDFIIDSIALVMEDKGSSAADLKRFFVSLMLYKGLRLHSHDLRDRAQATEEMSKNRLDFDDATALAAMLRLGISEIVSFDRDFDKARGVTRLEPKDFLK